MRTLQLPFLDERRWAALARERFWPGDFADGFRCGFGGRLHGQRDCDGFPGRISFVAHDPARNVVRRVSLRTSLSSALRA
jgi:hypothetical protein